MPERPQRPAEEWPLPLVINLWLHQLALLCELDQHLKLGEGHHAEVAFQPKYLGERVVFELANAQRGVRRGILARVEDLHAEGYGHHARQVIWERLPDSYR